LSFGGSGLRLPDSTIFGSGNSLLIETGAGQFTLNTAPYLTQVGMGLTYGPEGNPNTPPEPHDDNHPN